MVLPNPGFPANPAIAESLGIGIRYYYLRPENGFSIDLDEIAKLMDRDTRMLIVNSPHNPTGMVLTDADLETLHDLCWDAGVQFRSGLPSYLPRPHDAFRGASSTRYGHRRLLQGSVLEWAASRMDGGSRSRPARKLLQRSQLFHGHQQRSRRTSCCFRSPAQGSHSFSRAAHCHGQPCPAGPSFRRAFGCFMLAQTLRRNDRLPLVGIRPRCARPLPETCPARRPDCTRRLFWGALAFPFGVCRKWRAVRCRSGSLRRIHPGLHAINQLPCGNCSNLNFPVARRNSPSWCSRSMG